METITVSTTLTIIANYMVPSQLARFLFHLSTHPNKCIKIEYNNTTFSPINSFLPKITPGAHNLLFTHLSLERDDLNHTTILPHVRSLNIFMTNDTNVIITAITKMPNLRSLAIYFFEGITLNFPQTTKKLKQLSISSAGRLTYLNIPPKSKGPKHIRFLDCAKVSTSLRNFTHLKTLTLNTHLPDPTIICGLTHLKHLTIANYDDLTNIDVIKDLSNLQSLTLHKCENLIDINAIQNLEKLIALKIIGCTGLKKLDPIANASYLNKLILDGNSILTTLAIVENLKFLQFLSLKKCAKLSDINSLAHHAHLTHLDISNCKLNDITTLATCPNLLCLNMYNTIGKLNGLSGVCSSGKVKIVRFQNGIVF